MDLDEQTALAEAVSLLNRHEFYAAIEAFGRLSAAYGPGNPLTAAALNYRGFAYFCIGDEAAAEGDWTAVLALVHAGPERRRAARQALGRLEASRLLKQAASLSRAGDSGAAAAVYRKVLDMPGCHTFDQIAAASAVLDLPGAPDDVARQARSILDRYLGSGPIAGPAPHQEPAPALPPAHCHTVAAWRSRILSATALYALDFVMGGLRGALQFALIYLALGVAFSILGQDWSFLILLPLFGVLIGFLMGGGYRLIAWLERPESRPTNPSFSREKMRHGLP